MTASGQAPRRAESAGRAARGPETRSRSVVYADPRLMHDIRLDGCGLYCKRDVSVVHSDEMICILRAFAATRTNDPGCTPRAVMYGLCGSITKGLARGPSI